MMKRSKRRIAALAAIGLVASIAATAAPAQAADVHIKLVMASYTDAMTPYYTDLITRFQAANPGIIVDLDVVSWPEIGQKVKTLIASGQSPDVVNNDEFAGEAAAGLQAGTGGVYFAQREMGEFWQYFSEMPDPGMMIRSWPASR